MDERKVKDIPKDERKHLIGQLMQIHRSKSSLSSRMSSFSALGWVNQSTSFTRKASTALISLQIR
jgi:hypothetical protein